MGINIEKEEDELVNIRFNIPAILFGGGLTKKQFIICCYLLFLAGNKEYLNITPLRIAQELDFSPTAVLNHLHILQKRGYIGFLEESSTPTKYVLLTINLHNLM